MNKVEQARDIFENASKDATRMQIISKIQLHTNSGSAYASTLYNKARKMGTLPASQKPYADELAKKTVTHGDWSANVDPRKVAFIKNCWKIQGLKAGHYRNTFEYAHKMIEVIGVNKSGELMIVKAGTNVRVSVSTADAMNVLRRIKFLGKK